MFTVLNRVLLWPALIIWLLAVAVAAGLFADLLTSVPSWVLMVTGVTAWTATGWRRSLAILFLVVATGFVAWAASPLLPCWAAVVFCWLRCGWRCRRCRPSC
jgi:hypothetical protein